MEVAGVDGCPGGWLVVVVEATKPLLLARRPFVATRFQDVMDETRTCQFVAVDIPIGLSQGPEREADVAARELLASPKRSSVFRAPCRPVVEQTTDETLFDAVCRISRRFCRRKSGEPAAMTLQAYHIMKKVREVDSVMTPTLQARVIEVHPEVSLFAMNHRRPTIERKSRSAGRQERFAILSSHFADNLRQVRVAGGAEREDFLDACAAAWTATRYARGEASRLPPDPPVDSRGLRMEIVY